MLIALLNNLSTDRQRSSIWDQCCRASWEFGHYSAADNNAARFWKMEFDGNSVVDSFWISCKAQCEQVVEKPLRVVRQYANGHTYGLGGQPHSDDNRENCFTLLYYPMPEWEEKWEGETVFYEQNREIRTAIKPSSNRGILFDSRIPHVGRAPSRYCNGLRVTVAFKLEVET